MAKHKRIDVSGAANELSSNPFASLETISFPESNKPAQPSASEARRTNRATPNKKRGRIDVVREKAGRGGKTVTVLRGFKGISEGELKELAKAIQRACGVGGTLKGTVIEIQGDQRDRAMAMLAKAGFQPVKAGG